MTLQELIYTAGESLLLPFSYFNNPEKRIHYLYLLSSLLLAYYVFKKSKKHYSFLKYLFNNKVWLSPSAWVDYKLFFFNSFVKLFLIAPFLIGATHLSVFTEETLIAIRGYSAFRLSQNETIIYYTLALTICNDLMSYLVHLVFHKVPFLWRFHKTHHSATTLNPITQYRLHPIELIVNNAKYIFVYGFLTGLFEYLSDNTVSKQLLFNVNILSFLFLFWGANLRHSHVKLKYFTFIEHLFISPVQHQIHHSDNPVHFDKNLGSKLALWDWLFGTLILSKNTKRLSFGLGKSENTDYNTFLKNMLNPFRSDKKE